MAPRLVDAAGDFGGSASGLRRLAELGFTKYLISEE